MPATRPSTRKAHSSKPSLKGSAQKSSTNASSRVFTDVVLTIKPTHASSIAARTKNHEFRGYKLREGVVRLWLYESAPVKAISYVVETAPPRLPGEVNDVNGEGNDAFDASSLQSCARYAYPVRGLLKLDKPITRELLKELYGVTPSQGFCYANQRLVDEVQLKRMERIF